VGEARPPRVVVLGLTAGGLSLGRAFRRLGYPAVGVYTRDDEYGRLSRVFESVIPLPGEASSVASLAAAGEGGVLLVPCSDRWLSALMEAGDPLPEGVRAVVPPARVHDRWFSKERNPLDEPSLADLLAPPRSVPLSDWRAFSGGPGRWIVKPVTQLVAETADIGKNVLLGDAEDLARFAADRASSLDRFVVQEYIEGGDDSLVFTGGYASRDGRVRLLGSARKVWQSPPGRGVSVICRLESVPEVEERVRDLVEAEGVRGIFEAEWKWDARAGRWRFLEINLRGWLTLGMSLGGGLELARLILDDHGLPTPPSAGPEETPREWRDDMNLMVQAVKRRSLPPGPGARPVAHAYWRLADPLPFLAQLRRTIGRKLSRKGGPGR
jgi:predicted ATP-grasp superfamily ATP-dependent carboligase